MVQFHHIWAVAVKKNKLPLWVSWAPYSCFKQSSTAFFLLYLFMLLGKILFEQRFPRARKKKEKKQKEKKQRAFENQWSDGRVQDMYPENLWAPYRVTPDKPVNPSK